MSEQGQIFIPLVLDSEPWRNDIREVTSFAERGKPFTEIIQSFLDRLSDVQLADYELETAAFTDKIIVSVRSGDNLRELLAALRALDCDASVDVGHFGLPAQG